MTFRKRIGWSVIAITLVAMLASALSHAYATSFLLAIALLFSLRSFRKPVTSVGDIKDWLIALEGKDPFNPDSKPVYEWRGFVTTFVAALRIANHPTLSAKPIIFFRDEIDDQMWRALVTRIRHGAHVSSHPRKALPWF